ncbi:TIGR03668 family PPOX class F420-dependent oxidoreductase [Nocardia sp. NPDC005366]|uniref:TIGR03668 family PPOX class F420-dependent oxidoreductase n=1 Tax=Nocardia sp. NPDC005366 TaxID=3156878 RepID=UPI0033A4DAE9
MRLNTVRARELFAGERVARLATVSPDLTPHIVPIVFAVSDDIVYTAVDAKPKSTTALRRLANIAANPAVALLADHYADDWTRLWWVRADGSARLADAAESEHALPLLAARYPQYITHPPPGPVVIIRVTRWTGWAAS